MVSVPMSVVAEKTDISEESEVITDIEAGLEVLTSEYNLDNIEEELYSVNQTGISNSQYIAYIPDGIYAIRNTQDETKYIQWDASSTSEGSYLALNYSVMSPVQFGIPIYLFNITRVENSNRYIIRLVNQPHLTFNCDTYYVTTKEIPLNDDEVLFEDTFYIYQDGESYCIRNALSFKYICGTTSSFISAYDSMATPDFGSWNFECYRAYIDDGIYAFENVGNLGLWMDTQKDSYKAGAYAQQYAYDECPLEDMSRGGIFKISRIPNTDKYVIRLMTNNLLAWGINNTRVISQNVSLNNDEIPNGMTFNIIWENNGYMFIPSGTMQVVTATPNSNASGNEGAPESYLSVVSRNDATDSAKWRMYKYIGSDRCGADIILPDEIESIGAIVGNTYTISHTVWYTKEDMFDFSVSAINGALDDINIEYNSDNCTATITATNIGEIYFYIFADYTVNNIPIRTMPDDIVFYVIPQEGIYYLQNDRSLKYANALNASSNDSELIEQSEYSLGMYYKWEIKHAIGNPGYIQFKSMYNDKYIAVNPDDHSQICQYTACDDYSLWKLERLEKGTYRITCKALEDLGAVLTITDDSNLLSSSMYEGDNNTSDEWNLITKVISIVNYYDSYFIEEDDDVMINYIQSAHKFSNYIYARQYGIGIYMDGEPTQYNTIIDSCSLNKDAPCSNDICGVICDGMHHKNLGVISDQLYYDNREDDHIYVLWTNRLAGTYCIEDIHNLHTPVNYFGVVCNNRPIIQVLRVEGKKALCMGRVLAHEIMHTFEMDDVDDIVHADNDLSGMMCLMEGYTDNGLTNFYTEVWLGNRKAFCDICHQQVIYYTSNIDINGN